MFLSTTFSRCLHCCKINTDTQPLWKILFSKQTHCLAQISFNNKNGHVDNQPYNNNLLNVFYCLIMTQLGGWWETVHCEQYFTLIVITTMVHIHPITDFLIYLVGGNSTTDSRNSEVLWVIGLTSVPDFVLYAKPYGIICKIHQVESQLDSWPTSFCLSTLSLSVYPLPPGLCIVLLMV